MKIQILLFGIVSDIIGEKSISFELDTASTVSQFQEIFLKAYPNLNDYKSFAIAVNEEYANNNTVLKENDVLAIIPPVSGG